MDESNVEPEKEENSNEGFHPINSQLIDPNREIEMDIAPCVGSKLTGLTIQDINKKYGVGIKYFFSSESSDYQLPPNPGTYVTGDPMTLRVVGKPDKLVRLVIDAGLEIPSSLKS